MAKVKEHESVYRARRGISGSETISNAKASALHALEKLPGDATYDDIMYELYVLQKIEGAEEDVRRGKTVSHVDARKRLHRWLK
ncbi:MAG: hypothetical protein ACLP05_00255 [Candidatus Kryptoniota bacterium]